MKFETDATATEIRHMIENTAAYFAFCDKKRWADLAGSSIIPGRPSKNYYRDMSHYVYNKNPDQFRIDLEGLRNNKGHHDVDWIEASNRGGLDVSRYISPPPPTP